jgi:hypothetical protein
MMKPAWRKLLDTILADPQAALEEKFPSGEQIDGEEIQ